jgi:hypothetical protein
MAWDAAQTRNFNDAYANDLIYWAVQEYQAFPFIIEPLVPGNYKFLELEILITDSPATPSQNNTYPPNRFVGYLYYTTTLTHDSARSFAFMGRIYSDRTLITFPTIAATLGSQIVVRPLIYMKSFKVSWRFFN